MVHIANVTELICGSKTVAVFADTYGHNKTYTIYSAYYTFI
jgi:hypothetical protein